MSLLSAASNADAPQLFVDATFGNGGHSAALLERLPRASVIALDADPAAWRRAQAMASRFPDRLRAVHANFGDLAATLDTIGVDRIDGILYDLGISSLQLAESARGFSFAGDEPLDMRLDPTTDEPTASDLLNTLSEREIETILRTYGDERHARGIARTIVARRPGIQHWRTGDLVAVVFAARRSASRERIHPATRTFQALRIAVNQDLARLQTSLEMAVTRLRPQGRAVVISFQSAEDRIVKQQFKSFVAQGLGTLINRKPLQPTAAEIVANPRSRSAKLRAFERDAVTERAA